MKVLVLILFSTLIAETAYAEQRLSELRPGVPCSKILELEKRLGSVETAAHVGNGVIEYTGTQGGKKATIIYHCDNRRLTEQKVIFIITTRDEAYRFANEQKTELNNRLGDPIHDGLDLGTWRTLFFGFMGADLDYLTSVIVWGRADEDTMMSVKETGPNLWEVAISQGGSKFEYILNS